MQPDPDPHRGLGPVTTPGLPEAESVAEPADERGAPDLGVPTTLVLIRHGHTDDTGHLLVGGDGRGPALNGMGTQLVAMLGKVLADLPADPGPEELGRPRAVVTSPALRTTQTAALIGATLGVEPEVDDDLNE